jgi:hypothetical protein
MVNASLKYLQDFQNEISQRRPGDGTFWMDNSLMQNGFQSQPFT